MATNDITFQADKLDFATLDASEAEFFTIEYDDPDFADALGIFGGKIYLWINDFFNNFSADLWIEGEPVMEWDEESDEVIPTGEEKEPYYMEYAFTDEDLNAIQLRIIQYFHALLHGGKEYALKETSCPFGKEAWQQKYFAVRTPTGQKYILKAPAA